MTTRWKEAQWATPEALLAELETFYLKALALGKVTSTASVAAKKVVQHRGWAGVNPEHLLRAVEELGVIYIPTDLGPGPGLLFPIEDVTGTILRLQIRLLGEGPEHYGMKYMSLVNREAFIGPAWLGNDDETLEAIIQSHEVLLVEGPLDLLAIRTAGCPIPSLSTTSKRVTKLHWAYLRILGITQIYTLFDQDASEVGQKAAEALTRNKFGISVKAMTCPSKDPAEALKSPISARILRRMLANLGSHDREDHDAEC